MPKHDHATGQIVHTSGKDPRKLKPLQLTKDKPLLLPIWDKLTATSRNNKGVIRTFRANLDSIALLELVETRFNSDEWEIRLVTSVTTFKIKSTVKGLELAQFKAAAWARERVLRAAHCADELATMSIPF